MKQRIISALVALIIVVPLLIIGGYPFYIGVAIIGCLGFKELIDLKDNKKKIPILVKVMSYLAFLLLVLSNMGVSSTSFMIDYKIVALIIFSILIPLVIFHDNDKYNINDALFIIGSIFFLGVSFNFLITVRDLNLLYLIFLLLITIITDTFAYITGYFIGSHKMIPEISPKKTIEGLIGGTIMSTFVSTMFYINMFEYDKNIIFLILLVMLLSIIGQLGDLVFSSIKRTYDKKDFSNIMPGHGGILDRLDSIVFVILAFSFLTGIL